MNQREKKDSGQIESSTYYLEPGHIFFSTQSILVRTVLGNCVSVCLWDTKQKYGGINHYLYPFTDDAKKSTAKFGNVATIALIKMMEDAGCEKDNIIAQIFGGARGEKNQDEETGEENITMAKIILKKKNINIVSEDVGGRLGRKILFDISTGHVAVLKVHKIREEDWH